MTDIAASPAWHALAAHAEALRDRHLRDLFAGDPQRFERFSLRLEDLLFDYSKNRIDAHTLPLLVDLARAADVEGWRERMFAGEAINVTENRAVLHIALRNRSGRPILVDGEDVMPAVRDVLERMRALLRRRPRRRLARRHRRDDHRRRQHRHRRLGPRPA